MSDVGRAEPMTELARQILCPTPEEEERSRRNLWRIHAQLDRMAQKTLREALGGDPDLRLEG